MKRKTLATMAVLPLLLCGLLPVALGCDREVAGEVAGEVATLFGAYLGDAVAVVTTGCLHDALGIEDGDSADEHSHEAEPMHDHEH